MARSSFVNKYLFLVLLSITVLIGAVVYSVYGFWGYLNIMENVTGLESKYVEKIKQLELQADQVISSVEKENMSIDQKNLVVKLNKVISDFRQLKDMDQGKGSSSWANEFGKVEKNISVFQTYADKIKGVSEEKPEDLYKESRSKLIQLYRLVWMKKWVNLTKIARLIINDYDSLDWKENVTKFQPVKAKIKDFSEFIESSSLGELEKSEGVNALKEFQIAHEKFIETNIKWKTNLDSISKVASELKGSIGILIKYADVRVKERIEAARKLFFNVLIVCGSIVVVYIFFIWIFYYFYKKRIKIESLKMSKYVLSFAEPVNSEEYQYSYSKEFETIAQEINKAKKIIETEKRDEYTLKKSIIVPTIIFNKELSGIYWNSAFSNLFSVKSQSELGKASIETIFGGEKADAMAIAEFKSNISKEKDITFKIRLGEKRIHVEVLCSPIRNNDGIVDGVACHIRDITEEEKDRVAEINMMAEKVVFATQKFLEGEFDESYLLSSRHDQLRVLNELFEKAMHEEKEKRENYVTFMNGVLVKLKEIEKLRSKLRETVDLLAMPVYENSSVIDNAKEHIVVASNLAEGINEDIERIRQIFTSNIDVIDELRSGCNKQLEFINHANDKILQLEKGTSTISNREKEMREIFNRSVTLSLNCSILTAKNDFNRDDLYTYSENLKKLMLHFENMYEQLSGTFKFFDNEVKLLVLDAKQTIEKTNAILAEVPKISSDGAVVGVKEIDSLTVKIIEKIESTTSSLGYEIGELDKIDEYAKSALRKFDDFKVVDQSEFELIQSSQNEMEKLIKLV